jgi:rhamnosyltransferase subunit B
MQAGKPMIIIPYGFDQPDNAARAARLGISITLRKNKLDEVTLSQALEKLLIDKSYQEKVELLSLKIQSEDCLETVCKSVEALL